MKLKNLFLIGLVLVAILGIYAACHWLIWFSAVAFFGISGLSAKITLAAVLFLLAFSYLATSVVTHFFNNALTRKLYFAAAFWMGLVDNLVLALAIVWLAWVLLPALQGATVAAVFGTVAFVGALAFSVWGVHNAQHPIVKKISVPIADLPEHWKGKKIVQLSDIHLGYVYREKFMTDIARRVKALKPDVIVITGDLFDGHDGDLVWVGKCLTKLTAPHGVFYVTGNHETYLGVDEVEDILVKTNIVDLHDTFVDLDGLQLVGVDYPLRAEHKDVADVIGKMPLSKSKPRILLYHAPVQIEQIKKTGVALQLSGHTHAGQQFPFRLVSRIVYKGYDYGLHRDGNYTLYTTTGVGTWGPPMRTGNKPEIVCVTLE